MISYDEMPDDNAELAGVAVEFPRLEPDVATSCPVSMDDLLEYLGVELSDGSAIKSVNLRFLRTALVDRTHYWIWSFDESDGSRAFATVALEPNGSTITGYDSDYYGLTPEQFILGDYHQVF